MDERFIAVANAARLQTGAGTLSIENDRIVSVDAAGRRVPAATAAAVGVLAGTLIGGALAYWFGVRPRAGGSGSNDAPPADSPSVPSAPA